VQQAPLGAHQILQLQRHAVEVAAEIGELVAPASHPRADARLEVSGGGLAECPAQAADRPREIPGEDRAEGEARGDADDDDLPRRDRRLMRRSAGSRSRLGSSACEMLREVPIPVAAPTRPLPPSSTALRMNARLDTALRGSESAGVRAISAGRPRSLPPVHARGPQKRSDSRHRNRSDPGPLRRASAPCPRRGAAEPLSGARRGQTVR